MPLRFLLRPKQINITYNPPTGFTGTVPTISNPQLINFYVPIGDVLTKMGISLEGCGVYLVSGATEQMLDANLSLFNQNVPENSTILVRVATKAEAQLAASVHIWEEPENANTIVYNVDNFNEIHAATVNKLIEHLTSEKDHGTCCYLWRTKLLMFRIRSRIHTSFRGHIPYVRDSRDAFRQARGTLHSTGEHA